jgi:hypothetical protein
LEAPRLAFVFLISSFQFCRHSPDLEVVRAHPSVESTEQPFGSVLVTKPFLIDSFMIPDIIHWGTYIFFIQWEMLRNDG